MYPLRARGVLELLGGILILPLVILFSLVVAVLRRVSPSFVRWYDEG